MAQGMICRIGRQHGLHVLQLLHVPQPTGPLQLGAGVAQPQPGPPYVVP
jgi:hypothetical protein